jgi:hypothetical protein
MAGAMLGPMEDPMADPMGAPMGAMADPIGAMGAQLASCRSLPHSHVSGWKAPARAQNQGANMRWVKSRVLNPKIDGTNGSSSPQNIVGLEPFPHGRLVGNKETPE